MRAHEFVDDLVVGSPAERCNGHGEHDARGALRLEGAACRRGCRAGGDAVVDDDRRAPVEWGSGGGEKASATLQFGALVVFDLGELPGGDADLPDRSSSTTSTPSAIAPTAIFLV